MALRIVPIGVRFGRVDRDQVNLVVQALTANLLPVHAIDLMERGRSLWFDFLTDTERRAFYDMAQEHRSTIRKVQPADVWDALPPARPDLHAVLAPNGGREWLLRQAAEIKRELLR